MKSHKFNLGIITLFLLAFLAVPVHAQFGGLLKKAKEKISKTTEQTNSTNSSGAPDTSQPDAARSNVSTSSAHGRSTSGAALGQPGTIGLSKSPIDPKNWQAAQYTTSFTAGDPIYAIIFFGQPVTHLGTNDGNKEMMVWMVIDGSNSLSDYWDIPVKPEQKDATFITLPISPNPSDVATPDEATAASRFAYFGQKYDGNTLRVSFEAGGDRQAKLGGVTFDFSNGATAVYDALLPKYGQAVAANSDRVNANAEAPTAGMRNAALERQFTSMIQAAGAEWKMLKLIIASPEWQMKRHEISGVIIARYIVTRNIVREPAGNCHIQSVTFYQDYNGGGYGKTYMDISAGRTDDTAVSCQKAN